MFSSTVKFNCREYLLIYYKILMRSTKKSAILIYGNLKLLLMLQIKFCSNYCQNSITLLETHVFLEYVKNVS